MSVTAATLMSKISAALINYIINIIFKLMGGKESTGLKVINQAFTLNRSKHGARHPVTSARAV
jgi:ribosomal protein S7